MSVLRRFAEEVVAARDPHVIRQSFVGPLSYLLGAAAAWSSVRAAFVLYAVTPLCFLVPPQRGGAARAR